MLLCLSDLEEPEPGSFELVKKNLLSVSKYAAALSERRVAGFR